MVYLIMEKNGKVMKERDKKNENDIMICLNFLIVFLCVMTIVSGITWIRDAER